MNKLLIIILSSILIGCAHTPPGPTIAIDKVVHIDPRALQACEPLVGLNSITSFEDILNTSIQNMEIYADCKGKQDNSIILLKKFSNKE